VGTRDQCFDCSKPLDRADDEVYPLTVSWAVNHIVAGGLMEEKLSAGMYSIDLCHDCAKRNVLELNEMHVEAVTARPPESADTTDAVDF